MNFFEALIRNPVKVSVGILIVVLFGAISLVTMPKQLIPQVQNPVLTVRTDWPGASPREVEREIVQEQEEQLAAVEGLVKMTSSSRSGSGEITLEFAVGTPIGDAMQRVNTRLQQVRQYPENAQEPVIEASDVADRPIARFALTSRPPSKAVIREFIAEFPELGTDLQPALSAGNTGLRVYRLLELYDRRQDDYPLVDGAYAGDYFVDGEKIDLTIIGAQNFAQRTQDLQNLPIATRTGQVVPLSALADIEYSSGPESIMRRERLRAITISVSPPLTMPLEEAMQVIDQQIVAQLQEEGVLDGDTRIALSGTADNLREAWNALRWNLILALAITYLLMAALFESWLYPFVIILTVPLGAVGGVLGLWLLNLFVFQALDVLTMLGFVILIGTVVNNPILIVHQSLNNIRSGMTPRQAVPTSVQTRIRPIFITTTTTVLGLLPLVLFPGAGSELYRGLGSVVLGGLVVSTAFTLLLVPTVFILMMDAKTALARLLFTRQSDASNEDFNSLDGDPQTPSRTEQIVSV